MITTRNSLLEIISPWWTQPDLLVVAIIVIFVLLSWQPSNMELDWSRHPWAKLSSTGNCPRTAKYVVFAMVGAAVYLMLD